MFVMAADRADAPSHCGSGFRLARNRAYKSSSGGPFGRAPTAPPPHPAPNSAAMTNTAGNMRFILAFPGP